MVASLERGDYQIAAVIESASRQGSFYRNLVRRGTHDRSCDCPSWINNTHGGVVRSCKHTNFVHRLALAGQAYPFIDTITLYDRTNTHPLIDATRRQWGGNVRDGGLTGDWTLEMGHSLITNQRYLVTLLRLDTGNGDTVTGVVAFSERHHPTLESMEEAVVGWSGYTIASQVARLAGLPNVGNPPEHYQFRHTNRSRRTTATQPGTYAPIALRDILHTRELHDGLRPAERAENALRLFLGTDYDLLERQHFLDISSRFYRGRVYRLRRNPNKNYEHRVRVFENGIYTRDLCIVRGQDCPEPDWYLSVFLRLTSDERGLLSILSSGNIWPMYSDDTMRESIPAVWHNPLAQQLRA